MHLRFGCDCVGTKWVKSYVNINYRSGVTKAKQQPGRTQGMQQAMESTTAGNKFVVSASAADF